MFWKNLAVGLALLPCFCNTGFAGASPVFSDDFEHGDNGMKQFRAKSNIVAKIETEGTGSSLNHYLSIKPADDKKKICQMMNNMRPASSLAGTKLRFSAKVRGSGSFDSGIVPLLQGKSQTHSFIPRVKLSDQWQQVDFELDLTQSLPDQLLFWVRLFGESPRLDIDDLKLEQCFDSSVRLVPPSRCSVVQAGGVIPEQRVQVSGAKENLSGHFVYLQPSGKCVKIPAALKNGNFTLRNIAAEPGTHHFAFAAAGYSCPFTVIALPEEEYRLYRQSAEQLNLRNPLKILLLGDSLSAFRQGYNWASILESRLKQSHPESEIHNYACGGDTIQHVMKRLTGRRDVSFADHYKGLTGQKYDLVLVFLGQNDTVARKQTGFTKPQLSKEQQTDAFRKAISALKDITDAPVIIFSGVSTPQEVNAANAEKFGYRFGIPALVETYNRTVQQLCKEYGFTYWDIYTPMSQLPGKAGYFQQDGVHVNDAGNMFLARTVMNYLADYLAKHPSAGEKKWRVDTPAQGAWVLRNEAADWKGLSIRGCVPQNGPNLVVRKQFDLSALPPEALEQAKEVYLRMFFGILDYSICNGKTPNGLTEDFYIRINGHEKRYKTSDVLFPRTDDAKKKRRQEWCDVPIPTELLKEKKILTVEIGKVQTGDDYLYPCFDGSGPGVYSFVSYDGGRTFKRTWQKAPIGELMMRLVISAERPQQTAVYNPETGKKDDPMRVFSHVDRQKKFIDFEFASDNIDFTRPLKLNIDYSGEKVPEIALKFQGGEGERRLSIPGKDGHLQHDFLFGSEAPFGMTVDTQNTKIKSISVTCSKPLESAKKINLNPAMKSPAGKRTASGNLVKIQNQEITLSTPGLEMTLDANAGITLKKIVCKDLASQILRYPQQSKLFLIRCGSRDFSAADVKVSQVKQLPDGAVIHFSLSEAGLTGELTCRMENDEVAWGLSLVNSGKQNRNCTVVFPHLDGLVLSETPEQDYYLFPYGGGLIADCNTVLRTLYGANDAWYQLIDLFSPEKGGGFAMRIADTDTIFKAFNLRKGEEAEFAHKITYPDRPGKVDTSIQFTKPLRPGQGIGIAVDYQRKVLSAGKTLTLPPAVFASHAGNWKVPMKHYTAWAHKVWKFRPYPSKLTGLWNNWAGHGIGRPLYLDGKYHDRYISPNANLLELISYWTVSPLAPWDTPIENLHELGPVAVRRSKFGYWTDTATGKKVWAYNRGDYDGYNPQWGGLPALQKHIRKVQSLGKTVVLYTDPIIVCPTTKLGKSKGAAWGIVNPAWKDPFSCLKNPKHLKGHAFHHFSYCMCLNNPDYSNWVAQNMARLIRETGADGIRLDEYGHNGFICLSKEHPHIYPGNGENVWLRAIKDNVLAIRAETDKFKKDAILMSEYLGVDSLAATLDGALCYDVGRRTNALRPLAVNLFRFYFPECKLYELDETNKNTQKDVWLFNAVGVYNSQLYPRNYHEILEKYTSAFAGDVEPLVDTLVPYVYANRFAAPDRSMVVHTIFNKTGHTVDEPLIPVKSRKGFKFMDAFTGKTLVPERLKDGREAIRAKISNNRVFVLAEIPQK